MQTETFSRLTHSKDWKPFKCKSKKHNQIRQLGAILKLSSQLYSFYFAICLHTNLPMKGLYFEMKDKDN